MIACVYLKLRTKSRENIFLMGKVSHENVSSSCHFSHACSSYCVMPWSSGLFAHLGLLTRIIVIVWTLGHKYDYAFPCATQNEIDEDSGKICPPNLNISIYTIFQNRLSNLKFVTVKQMIKKGLKGLFEGANLPTQMSAQDVLREHPDVIYIPGKAANAGGVGVSGFEMQQNAQKTTWKPEIVDEKLKELMAHIYSQLLSGVGDGSSLESGANRAGFMKVVEGMEDLGWL